MTPTDDYRHEVSDTEFVDQDVERLLTGQSPDDPKLRDLAGFVAALRSEATFAPSNEASELIAEQAAEIVRTGQQTKHRLLPRGQVIARPDRRPSLRPARAAFALSGFFLLIVAVGLGLVANLAVPGDPLYSIDRAMEAVGIGNGTVDERLDEADSLVEAGDTNTALLLLGETYEKAIAKGDTDGAQLTDRKLVSVSSANSGTTQVASAKVERIRQFLAENAGPGVGLDGQEFERALKDIIQDDS